jgi:hypothetical protein
MRRRSLSLAVTARRRPSESSGRGRFPDRSAERHYGAQIP